MKFEPINTPLRIDIGISPNEADLAIVSIDAFGSPGMLNRIVLKEYGYSEKDLPNNSLLEDGYFLLRDKKRKPILFIVTVGKDNTENNLENNLFNALVFHNIELIESDIWIPLMGTGDGGLTLEKSYKITVRSINKFQREQPTKTTFLFSIPDTNEGREFIKRLKNPSEPNTEAKAVFKKFKGQFFVAGCTWDNEDQSNRFFEESIWENGNEEKFIQIVKSTKIGDVVFLKSTYSAKNKSYLRIKGVGKVTENPQTGTELKVDWKIKNSEINIEQMGKYRRTYARVMPDDIEKLVDGIDIDKMVNAGLFEPTIASIEKKTTYAELIADSVDGDDHLEIGKDVLAFSRVMAAKSFKPPLAIALFGKWGSGKSFFMNKLKNSIENLSSYKDESSPYCKGIAHIHFNAWSYLDANLWAGMVTRIFEGLNEYISNDTKAKEFKDDIEKELSKELNVTKEEVHLLEKKKEAVEEQLKKFKEQKKSITEKLNNNIDVIGKKTLKDIISNIDEQFKVEEKINQALEQNETYQITKEDLKTIIPQKYWQNPSSLYEQIKSKQTFLREFFRRDKIGWNLFWLVIILAVIFIVPIVLNITTNYLKETNFLIPQVGLSFLITIGAIWKRAENTYKKLQPLIASFWNIKVEHEQLMKEAIFEFEQKEKALMLQIEQSKSEIEIINSKIQDATVTMNDLDFRINNALATEALYSFIEKRSSGEDYQKYLGIVSIVRNDFKILSELFLEHNDENSQGKIFREKFDKPLERIILYIDDLDRCPEDRVVEVLEAVNLLMAFPLFIVVVGVDSRWVKNALLKKYQLQFNGHSNGADISKDYKIIEASNYLEKIFQVPFHLKEASDNDVKNMLKILSEPKIRQDVNLVSGQMGDEAVQMGDNVQMGTFQHGETIKRPEQKQTSQNSVFSHPSSFALTEREMELLQEFSLIIGNNPRAIKRFINVYQIVRAHEELTYNIEQEEKEFLVMMFLLALPIGPFQKLTLALREYISDDSNQLKKLSSFLAPQYKIDGLDELKHKLDVILTDKKSYNILQGELIGTFKIHNAFIQRFTFEDCI